MRSLPRRIPTLILQGFLALLPLIITSYFIRLLYRIFRDSAGGIIPLLPAGIRTKPFVTTGITAAAVLMLLAILLLTGLAARSVAGKALLKMMTKIFTALPGLGTVYRATEQVVTSLSGVQSGFFANPVLVEYPSQGIWAVAFRTGEIRLDSRASGQKFFTVFIPTTPNPTSGFLAVIAADRIRELDLPAEDAVKLILTGGLVKNASLTPAAAPPAPAAGTPGGLHRSTS